MHIMLQNVPSEGSQLRLLTGYLQEHSDSSFLVRDKFIVQAATDLVRGEALSQSCQISPQGNGMNKKAAHLPYGQIQESCRKCCTERISRCVHSILRSCF